MIRTSLLFFSIIPHITTTWFSMPNTTDITESTPQTPLSALRANQDWVLYAGILMASGAVGGLISLLSFPSRTSLSRPLHHHLCQHSQWHLHRRDPVAPMASNSLNVVRTLQPPSCNRSMMATLWKGVLIGVVIGLVVVMLHRLFRSDNVTVRDPGTLLDSSCNDDAQQQKHDKDTRLRQRIIQRYTLIRERLTKG